MPELIGTKLGSYQIISKVGAGGMTVVYKAYQPNLDRYVALKVLSPQYIQQPVILERFFQEVQIISRLEHPHIVPMYDYGESEGYFYIVMRLIESGSLYDRFHGQPFPLNQTRQVISQIGDALDYAHSQGIVHRDIKMKNILIDGRDNALLTDFGIAKVLQRDSNLTQVGRTLGTPAYMAPEQIQGDPVDGRTDIYALGILLYQLTTGRFPYLADSSHEIIMMHLYNPLPSARSVNPELSEALDEVITRALAKSPGDRYPTAGEMVRAVQEATMDNVPTLIDEDISVTLPSLPARAGASPPVTQETTGATPLLVMTPASGKAVANETEATSFPPLSQAQKKPHRPGRKGNLLIIIGSIIILLLVVVIGLLLYFGPRIQDMLTELAAAGTTSPAVGVVPSATPGATLPPGIIWEELLDQPEIIQVSEASESDWIVFEGVYQDFILQAEMTQLSGGADSYYGVTVRESEDGNSYYSFEISQEGFWEFYKVLNCPESEEAQCDLHLIRAGESETLRRQGLQTLQIEAVGPDFTFYLNGEKIEGISDSDFATGYTGLIVTAGAEGGAEVSFNRLKIIRIK